MLTSKHLFEVSRSGVTSVSLMRKPKLGEIPWAVQRATENAHRASRWCHGGCPHVLSPVLWPLLSRCFAAARLLPGSSKVGRICFFSVMTITVAPHCSQIPYMQICLLTKTYRQRLRTCLSFTIQGHAQSSKKFASPFAHIPSWGQTRWHSAFLFQLSGWEQVSF